MRVVKTIITANEIEVSELKKVYSKIDAECYVSDLHHRAVNKYHLKVIKKTPLTLSYYTASNKIVMFHYDTRNKLAPHKKAYQYQVLLKSKSI